MGPSSSGSPVEAGAASCFRILTQELAQVRLFTMRALKWGGGQFWKPLCGEASNLANCCLPGIDELTQPSLAAALILQGLLEDCDKWCMD